MPGSLPSRARPTFALALVCLALVAIGAAWLWLDPAAPAVAAPAGTPVLEAAHPQPVRFPQAVTAAVAPSGPPPRGSQAPPTAAARPRPAAADAVDPIAAPSAVWRIAQGPPIEMWIGSEPVLAVPLHLDGEVVGSVAPGDRLTVPIPELGALEIEIERVASPAEGITVIQGHLAAFEENWPVSITRGPELMLASVTTPSGTWFAEFAGETGWVAFDDLEDRLVDHSIPDMRTPPGSEIPGEVNG